jgi:hypothetical protein
MCYNVFMFYCSISVVLVVCRNTHHFLNLGGLLIAKHKLLEVILLKFVESANNFKC